MDRNETIGALVLGMTFVGMFYLLREIRQTQYFVAEVAEVVTRHIEIDFQEEVDEKFAEIVENYEE